MQHEKPMLYKKEKANLQVSLDTSPSHQQTAPRTPSIHDPNQLFAAANHTTSPTNHTNLLTFPTQTQIKKIGREKTEKPRRI